jgi:DNA-directed RNA polymerase specialized sigma24 family protein
MFDRHEVWTLHNTGEYSQRRIAKTLGISRTSVQRILSEAPSFIYQKHLLSFTREGR